LHCHLNNIPVKQWLSRLLDYWLTWPLQGKHSMSGNVGQSPLMFVIPPAMTLQNQLISPKPLAIKEEYPRLGGEMMTIVTG